MRYFGWFLPALLLWSPVCLAQPTSSAPQGMATTSNSHFLANNNGFYVGGRGVITFEGPTGMFINPTSGTLAQGQSTVQACTIALEANNENIIGYNALVSHGVTDWLEFGAIGQVIDLDNEGDNQSIAAGGPYARVRLFKDERWWPEFSIGGFAREGNDLQVRRTIFTAASKRFVLDTEVGIAFRLHAGFRQYWQPTTSVVTVANGSVGYMGGEVELPKHVYFISEVSTKDDLARKTPYAVGIQVRHPDGIAFTLSGVQPGDQDHPGIYIGIGINF